MKKILFIISYIIIAFIVFLIGYFILGSESFRYTGKNPNFWNIFSCIIILIMGLAAWIYVTDKECEYPIEKGKYCKKKATKLHLPESNYSCDEHSEYFRRRNNKTIDL